jgi:nitroreductase
MLRDLVLANRSYRRFDQRQEIDTETLRSLVDLARCTPSAANLQPLKYIITNTPERNADVFATLAWAGYLADWPGPVEGERPSAYIVVLLDTCLSKSANADLGIAAQTILLGAAEKGLGGCMFGSIDRDRLRKELAIDECSDIMLVMALGKPVEKVVLEDVGPDGSIKYYRDADAVHHVPKRTLDDVIVG